MSSRTLRVGVGAGVVVAACLAASAASASPPLPTASARTTPTTSMPGAAANRAIPRAERFDKIEVKNNLVLGTKWGNYNHLLGTYEHKTFVVDPTTGRAAGSRPFHEINRTKDGGIVGVTVPDASNNRYAYVLDAKGKPITPVFDAIRSESGAVAVGTQKGLQWVVDPTTKKALSTDHAFSLIKTAPVGEGTVVIGASFRGAIGDYLVNAKTGRPVAGAEKFDRLEAQDGLLLGTHLSDQYNAKLGTYDRNVSLVSPATGRAIGRPFQEIYRDKSGKIVGVEAPFIGETRKFELDAEGNVTKTLK